MPFTDSEVRSLTATYKMQKKSVGDCLCVILELRARVEASPSTGSCGTLLAVVGRR